MRVTNNKGAIITGIILTVLFLGLFSIGLRFCVRQLLVKRLGMDNAFTKMVFFDMGNLNNGKNELLIQTTNLNWEVLYPHTEDDNSQENSDKSSMIKVGTVLNRYTAVVDSLKSKVDTYATDFFIGYNQIVFCAQKYEELIGWNFASFGEYNGIVELDDGYLTSYIEKIDMTEAAQALIDLERFCRDEGVEFLYVQAPYKISEYQDEDISGKLDFSNQNANALLEMLRSADIAMLDLREIIHDNKWDNHALFYVTDHHWKTSTGIWAAEEVAKYCKSELNYDIDLDLYRKDQFEYQVYENWFLGSQGKKVTLARAEPDDFVLIKPLYDTSFKYRVYGAGVDTSGKYEIMYDMSQLEEKNYYGKNPYAACNYSDQPLIQIENYKIDGEKKILVVHDSFGNCFIPPLALGVKYVDAIHLRHFNGSLKKYIQVSAPDLVIVMYNPSAFEENIDKGGHISYFDFE